MQAEFNRFFPRAGNYGIAKRLVAKGSLFQCFAPSPFCVFALKKLRRRQGAHQLAAGRILPMKNSPAARAVCSNGQLRWNENNRGVLARNHVDVADAAARLPSLPPRAFDGV